MRKKKSEPLAAFYQEAFDWPVKDAEALLPAEPDLHPGPAEEDDVGLSEEDDMGLSEEAVPLDSDQEGDEEQETFVRRTRVTMIGRVTGRRKNYTYSQF